MRWEETGFSSLGSLGPARLAVIGDKNGTLLCCATVFLGIAALMKFERRLGINSTICWPGRLKKLVEQWRVDQARHIQQRPLRGRVAVLTREGAGPASAELTL